MATAMDGVLDSVSVLCVFKLVCSLIFLPSLANSRSPIGFCGCCILFFTDFLVTVYVSFLSLFESWLTELSLPPDIIALRFLLFLSHTYGAVLLLTMPLITMETLTRLLRSQSSASCKRHSEVASREEESENEVQENEGWRSQATSYLCCLAVWVLVAFSVQCRWRLEEVRQVTCLRVSGSLMRCLPNLLSPLPSAVHPCWGMAFLYLLLLLLLTSSQHRWKCATCAATTHSHDNSAASKLLESHQGDFPVVVACDCPSEGEQEGAPLIFIMEESKHTCGRRRSGAPHPGVNLTIASLAVLAIFVLPLYLGVNILLLRSVEALLDMCIRFLLFSTPLASKSHMTHEV
ncbi:uncharacterized protein LOC129185850 [Dunckerocampus dactyliophorus]|uniref:uncharacterized protein LOC129185850 n=1 Tax=Dunckerocampus dactyliophorus TaxID=161453 RepID=UPI0024063E10|nr:uncharacterized protein LOC129185850 [Dunckerocampus dactyliophorus]